MHLQGVLQISPTEAHSLLSRWSKGKLLHCLLERRAMQRFSRKATAGVGCGRLLYAVVVYV